jgi:chromate reductase, NAD(P)H dehydrogenase (quinone)
MADQVKVVSICGSLRKGSFNAALARLAPKLAPPGMAVTPAPSLDTFPLYNHDLAAAIRAADGVLICSPEYNWSIPGVLKNAIDWVSRMKEQPFATKPVAIQSAATGLIGGSRMQYHLRQSLTSIDAVLFGRPEVIVTFAGQKFDDNLELKDQPTVDLIKQQLAGFEKLIRKVTGK